LAFKKTDEGRSCLAETSLQVLLTLFLTLTRVSAKHNKFSIDFQHCTLATSLKHYNTCLVFVSLKSVLAGKMLN